MRGKCSCGLDHSTLHKLSVGVYVGEQGTVHIDVDELLEANGFACTERNRQVLAAAAKEVWQKEFPTAVVGLASALRLLELIDAGELQVAYLVTPQLLEE